MDAADNRMISKISKLSFLCALLSIAGLLFSGIRVKIGQEIVGEIFSLFMLASVPAVILSLIDILRKGAKSKILSFFALFVGGLIAGFFLLLLIWIFIAVPTHHLEF